MKYPAFLILSAALSVSAAGLHAQLIPASRLTTWTPGTTVGVPGGIPTNRTNLVDVTLAPYNADKTGAADASTAIQNAINAAAVNSVVYLPAGRYLVNNPLYFGLGRDGITLRGAGPSTVLDCRSTSSGISVGTATDYNWAWPASGNVITAGLAKGSTQITIADTSAFSVGQMIQISINNDLTIPVVSVSGYGGLRRQKTLVTAKTATTLSIFPGLYGSYGPSGQVNVAQRQVNSVGIEDMVIDCSNGATTFVIEFEQCYGCWVKNVESRYAANYHVFLYDSLNCEVRHSYLNQLNHSGSNGAGLLCNTSSACLVEDNIIYKAFPLMEINHGSCGNVFAYNFCEDSSVYGGEGAGIDSNHGPHNSYNLYEGNVAPNLQCDGYFGSASEDTAFRNWFHGTCPGVASGWSICLNRFTRNYSLVGNMLGKTGATVGIYSFGNPNMGNGNSTGTVQPSKGTYWADWGTSPGPSGFQELDLDVQASAIVIGNWNSVANGIPATESLGSNTLPNSLYLTAKPAWFGNLTWPAFNPAAPNQNYDAIPAGYRYVHGIDPPAGPVVAPSNAKTSISSP
jgi:hypothetical protein